jgi:AhpD family alkylhydroperoxidase
VQPRLDFYQPNPQVIKALIALEERAGVTALERPLIELVCARALQINDHAYCADMHGNDARRNCDNEHHVTMLVKWRETAYFTPRERAALEWVDAVAPVVQRHVPDSTWEVVLLHFSDSELVDLTVLIFLVNSWKRFASAFPREAD